MAAAGTPRRRRGGTRAAVAQPRRDGVEHDSPGRDPRRAGREQTVHVRPGQVHQQPLCGDEHGRRGVELVEPALVQGGTRDQADARLAREQLAAQRDRLGEVDADPPHGALVDAPELGLEALAQGDHRPARVVGQEAAHLAVEARRPQGLPLGQRRCRRSEPALEREVDRADELDGPGIAQHGVRATGLGRAVVEVPEEGLGDDVELDRHACPLPVPAEPVTPGRLSRSGARCSRATCAPPSRAAAAARSAPARGRRREAGTRAAARPCCRRRPPPPRSSG